MHCITLSMKKPCLQEVAIIEIATMDVPENSVELDEKIHQWQLHSKFKNKKNNHCEQYKTYCCGKHTGAKSVKIILWKVFYNKWYNR